MPRIGRATFPWANAMLATKQCNPVEPALDLGCWGVRARDVPHAWSARRRGSGHRSGRLRRSCESEANEQDLGDLRNEPSQKQGRTRSRERCARAAALPGALGWLGYGVRIPAPIRKLLRWGAAERSAELQLYRRKDRIGGGEQEAARGDSEEELYSLCVIVPSGSDRRPGGIMARNRNPMR